MQLYQVPRYINQELFDEILLNTVRKEFDEEFKDIINDVFELRHYDWNESNEEPNFYHKPSGYKLWWYKYPLRGAEANMEISIKQFADILYDCKEAYQNQNGIKVSYNVGNIKWWLNKKHLSNIEKLLKEEH